MPFDMSDLENMDFPEKNTEVPVYDHSKYNPMDYATLEPEEPGMEDFEVTEAQSAALFAQARKVNYMVDLIAYAIESQDSVAFATALTAFMIFGFKTGYNHAKSEDSPEA